MQPLVYGMKPLFPLLGCIELINYRPHAAAATSQAIFHVTKLREMLEGKMSVTAWSEISRKYSLIIYNSAIEMGNILMHQPISLEGKINTFMPKFRNTHVELDKLYNELA